MDKKFIRTTDKDTAEQLIELGFKLLSQSNGAWTFINEPKSIKFDAKPMRLTYSNVLTF